MDTPVLLIAWRRPQTLRQLINAIRPIAPTRLFVACDGPNPNRPGEAEKVAATRDLIEQEIDWPCQIEKLYSDVNQGCRLGVSRAITWFFERVEEGIILEDDCVPDQDFFSYCQTLLERYRFDTRVWCISGNNFQDGIWRGDASYYFSHYNHCWGWASWRRCWQHYDVDIKEWPKLKRSSFLKTIFPNYSERLYWSRIWDGIYFNSSPDTWDYQWTFICLVNGGLTALPNKNLVNNIGFGPDATHTLRGSSGLSSLANYSSKRFSICLTKPFVLRNHEADLYTFKSRLKNTYLTRFFCFLKKVLNGFT